MKKLLYVLLLLIEGLLMAGTETPVSSPQHGPQNPPPFDFSGLDSFPTYDEAEVKQAHATDFKQAKGISSPYNTPVVLGTPATPYRMPKLVRSSSDSQLVYLRPAPNAASFIRTFGYARAAVLAHLMQRQEAQKQELKAE